MKPMIEKTTFGSITIAGKKYKHDVLVRLDGRIEKRNKNLSKALYGTSHMISLEEAKFIYEAGAELLIIGSGKFDSVRLSQEATEFFNDQHCQVDILPTPVAIHAYNHSQPATIALFHVTC